VASDVRPVDASGGESMAEPATLAVLRRFLLAVLIFGVIGMGTELLFIGHIDGTLQLIPVTALGCGLLALGWLVLAPSGASVRAVQAMMLVFVVAGGAGVVLHFRGNAEFELEMRPRIDRLELVRETLTGATPVLAPGSMALLGLVGLAVTFRHPSIRIRSERQSR
jgi:hypothetical protein